MACGQHFRYYDNCWLCRSNDELHERDKQNKKQAARMREEFERNREAWRREREDERLAAEATSKAARPAAPPPPPRPKSDARISFERTVGRFAACALIAGLSVAMALKVVDLLAFALGPVLIVAAGTLLAWRHLAAGAAHPGGDPDGAHAAKGADMDDGGRASAEAASLDAGPNEVDATGPLASVSDARVKQTGGVGVLLLVSMLPGFFGTAALLGACVLTVRLAAPSMRRWYAFWCQPRPSGAS